MSNSRLTNEERDGLIFSVTIHGLILLLSVFMTVGPKPVTYRFMAVSIGAFESGTPSDQVAEVVKEIATDPNPQDTPVNKIPKETFKPTEPSKSNTKPVEAPKQKNVTNDDLIKTPAAKKVDPKTSNPAGKANPSSATTNVQSNRSTEGAKPEDGTQRDAKNSAFIIDWAGEFKRDMISTPKPDHKGENGVVKVDIEVLPNGRVRIIRFMNKSSQTNETEVRRTLASWRFEALPQSAPQVNQKGTITFNFTL